MSPIKKLYQSELRRIKRRGIKVHSSRQLFRTLRREFGFEGIAYFIHPNTILIDKKIKTICYKLCILLHEEYHWLDKKVSHCTFLREYRAQRYVIQKALAFNNKLLIRQVIASTKSWLGHKGDTRYHHYYCAAKKLMKTKLWDKLCQN